MEITKININNTADNIIPGVATAIFNVRFNNKHSSSSLKKKINKVIKKISAKKAKKLFLDEMADRSLTILKRIETFVWTINRDGRDYHPSNPCGCSGVTKMAAKEKVRGTHCTIAEHGRIKMTKNNFFFIFFFFLHLA